jgi:multisubunit Na+/H+ antiporter MnhG subunit
MFGWVGIIVGILFLLFAAFAIFFFPGTFEHQSSMDTDYGLNGIILGIIVGIIGIVLLFLP